MKDRIYFNIVDFIINVIVTIILWCIGGFKLLNDGFFVLMIYIISLALTNANMKNICKHDQGTRKARKRYEKSINNSRSPKKELPRNIREWGKNYDYDCCFEAIKLVLGMVVIIVLAVISALFHLQNSAFGKFTYGFYIDAFLLPALLITLQSFWVEGNFVKTIQEFLKNIFYKDGKLRLIKGFIVLLLSVFLIVLALISTMAEFVTDDVGLPLKWLCIIVGIAFLVYSIWNSIKND